MSARLSGWRSSMKTHPNPARDGLPAASRPPLKPLQGRNDPFGEARALVRKSAAFCCFFTTKTQP